MREGVGAIVAGMMLPRGLGDGGYYQYTFSLTEVNCCRRHRAIGVTGPARSKKKESVIGERGRKGEVSLGPGSEPVDRVPAGARYASRDKGYQGVIETICCEELGGTLGARFTEIPEILRSATEG